MGIFALLTYGNFAVMCIKTFIYIEVRLWIQFVNYAYFIIRVLLLLLFYPFRIIIFLKERYGKKWRTKKFETICMDQVQNITISTIFGLGKQ